MTRVIGLTGGIATGKTTVANLIKQHNIPVLDMDQLTHDLESHNQALINDIQQTFGAQVIKQQQVDRQALGKIVFADANQMKQLVSIVNPYLFKAAQQEINQHDLLVLDAPTLFENGFDVLADTTIMVTCNPIVQMRRLMQRDDLTLAAANQRMYAQWPQQVKKQLAHVVLDSSNGITDLKSQTEQLLIKIAKD